MDTDIQPGGLLRTLIVPHIESFQRIVGSQIKKQKERLQPPFSLFKVKSRSRHPTRYKPILLHNESNLYKLIIKLFEACCHFMKVSKPVNMQMNSSPSSSFSSCFRSRLSTRQLSPAPSEPATRASPTSTSRTCTTSLS